MDTSSRVLCQISQMDCKHDFGENARQEYYSNDEGCEEYSVNEAGLTRDIIRSGFYNNYTCYHKGTRIIPDIRIQPGSPIEILDRLSKINIVCDFTVGPFIEDIRRLGSKVVLINNNERNFDAASKGDYGLASVKTSASIVYKKNDTFVRSSIVDTDTICFYLSTYNSAKMFNNSKTYVVFNKANKLFVVDRDYCKNNGIVNKLANGNKHTINYVIGQIQGILNGTIAKQGNTLLKYISKRLGDQGQAISALRLHEGNRCVFVTHDTCARDFAITIGVPYVIWTYSGVETAGYYLFVNETERSEEEMEQEASYIRETEERENAIRTRIQVYIHDSVRRINTLLQSSVKNVNDVKRILKGIINDVYFLNTYYTVGTDISGLELTDIQVVDFPNVKNKFDNLRLHWDSGIDNRSINITGIKNTYLCADELIKIYSILKKVNSILLDKYVDFINKIIEIVNSGDETSRVGGIYKTNASRFLSNIVVGVTGGGPHDNFFNEDEDIHAYIYLLTELVNLFRDNITNDFVHVFEKTRTNEILHIICDKVSYEPLHDGTKDDDVDFVLPFENNKNVQLYLQKFIDYKHEINTGIDTVNTTDIVVNTIILLYKSIEHIIDRWHAVYTYFKFPDFHVSTKEALLGKTFMYKRHAENDVEEPLYISRKMSRMAPGWAGGNKHTRKCKIHIKIRRNLVDASKRRSLKHRRR